MPTNGDTSISALTFGTLLSSQESDAHRASDFRLKLRGNSPYFTVSLPAGQIGLFDPVSLRDSVSETRQGVFRLPNPSGSLLKGRPLSRPAPRSNKKNITDIRGADANRGPGPSSEPPGTCPRHRHPASREAALVPLVTPLARVSASDTSIMPHPHKSFSAGGPRGTGGTQTDDVRDGQEDDEVGASRLPPVTCCTAQQTPLGEWPLVAA